MLSSHHGKLSLGLRVLDLNSKVQILIVHTKKQSNNMLKFTNYTKTKLFNSKQKWQNKPNKQNRKKTLENLGEKNNLCCWMKLVGVVPSSSTCTRK